MSLSKMAALALAAVALCACAGRRELSATMPRTDEARVNRTSGGFSPPASMAAPNPRVDCQTELQGRCGN